MLAALQEHMPPEIAWTRPRGGFFSWVTLPPNLDAMAISASARDGGVVHVPGPYFQPDGRGHNSLRLSFSKVEDASLDEGIRRLARLFQE